MADNWDQFKRADGGSEWDRFARAEAVAAPVASESFPQKLGRMVLNAEAGALRGAGSIGATLLSPIDWAARQLNDGKPISVGGYDIAGHDRRSGMDQGLSELGADTDSLAFKGGKIGAEVAGTLGVGGGLAKGLSAIPSIASKAPGFISAVESAGMTAPNMLTRMAGGATVGGASAGLVNPEDAGLGAVIGGAAPPAIKVAAWSGKKIAGAAKSLLTHALGMATGVGPEPIKQAFKAGAAGNKDFIANLNGDVPLTEVLDRAKQALQKMAADKSAAYRNGMIPVQNDKTILSLSGIDQAVQDAQRVVTFKGQIKNTKAADAVQEMADAVAKWKALDPAQFHTPEGIDALKQKLGGILESIPFEQKTARLAAGKVYDAAKSEITTQAPTYANVMKDYAEASQHINEIERALSLGKKSSQDTAMRKLQSLMRNNVQTNYGNRLTLAHELEKAGGVELMPSLAGQALSSWTPRSLAGQIGGSTLALGAAFTHNPFLAAGLLAQSPHSVGAAAYGAGKVGGAIGQGLIGGPQSMDFLYRAAPVGLLGGQ